MTHIRPDLDAVEPAPGDGSFHDRTFPALNAVRAAGAIMVVLTHAAFNTGRINDGWVGAALARLRLRRDAVLRAVRVPAQPAVVPRGRARTARTRRPGTTCGSARCGSSRSTGSWWSSPFLVDPQNEDATWQDWVSQLTLTQLYRHELLASSLTQMWSLCTEVAFYLVLPLICLALTGRRPRTLRLNRVLVGAAVISVAGVVWQVVGGPDPRLPGATTRQWLPGYLPWFMVGLAFAAVSASLAVHPREHVLDRLGARPGRLLDPRRRRLRPGLLPLGGAAAAAHARRVGGRRQGVLYAVAGAFFVLPLVFGPEREGWARRAAERAGAVLARRDLLRHLRDPHDRAEPGLPGPRPRRVHRPLPDGGGADPRRRPWCWRRSRSTCSRSRSCG